MSGYTNLIREGIRATRPDLDDDRTAAVVEEIMRTNRTGLDHLTRAEFLHEAGAFAAVLEPAFVAVMCDLYGLPLPSWASSSERCTVCGMIANVDPSLHAERYAHIPRVRRDGVELEFDFGTYAFTAVAS